MDDRRPPPPDWPEPPPPPALPRHNTHAVPHACLAPQLLMHAESSSHPAIGIPFATQLPNASNEKGIYLDTTDVSGTLLLAKTIQSIRVVGNLGAGILTNPTSGVGQKAGQCLNTPSAGRTDGMFEIE